MTAFVSTDVTVNNGSNIVTVNDNVDFSQVKTSSILFIANNAPVIVDAGTGPDLPSPGASQLTLRSNWTDATVNNGKAILLIGMSALVDAITKANESGIILANMVSSQSDLFETSNAAYQIQIGTNQTVTVPTYQYLVDQFEASQTVIDSEIANLKASKYTDFEARREMNKLQYAASGFVEFGKAFNGSSLIEINQGLQVRNPTSGMAGWENRIDLGRDPDDSVGSSRTSYALPLIDGIPFNLRYLGTTNDRTTIKLPEAPTARPEASTTTTSATSKYEFVVTGNDVYICIADAPNGTLLTNTTYFEPREEVSREDLVGFESFLVELGSDGIDAVYPRGLVQNGVTTYEGQSLSNAVMAQGYSAFGEWDTATQGYGKQWSTMSVLERDVWINDTANNIYVKDGKYYQWQGRMRSIRGLGNDWDKIVEWDEALDAFLHYTSINSDAIKPRGSLTTTQDLGVRTGGVVDGAYVTNPYTNDVQFGAFKATSGGTSGNFSGAVDGQCFFLPICTVTRRNQGAYHPFLNELGTASHTESGASDNIRDWYSSSAHKPTNKADCFKLHSELGAGVDTFARGGSIANGSGQAGRPDGKFYDAIDEGDITDYRMSARTFDESPESVLQSFVNGTRRGVEGLPILHLPVTNTATSDSAASFAYQASDTSGFVVGGKISVIDSSGNVLINRATITSVGANVNWDGDLQTYVRTNGQDYTAIQETESNIKFATLSEKGIIATPANLTTLMTNTGVTSILGARFIGVPDGTSIEFKIEGRKVIESLGQVYTGDNGTTWTSQTSWDSDFESSSNSTTRSPTASLVYLCNYKTPAYALESADHVSVDGAELSDVVGTNAYNTGEGAVLCANLTGFVPTEDGHPKILNGFKLSKYNITSGGNFYSGTTYKPTHDTIPLGGTSNGVKVFAYLYTDDNRLVWPYFRFKQMIHDTSLDSGSEFTDVAGSTAQNTLTAGNYYHITSGSFAGFYRCVTIYTGNTLDNESYWSRNSDGDLIAADGTIVMELWDGNGFGDNDQFEITDGIKADVPDNNGNYPIYGLMRGKMPLGPARRNS